MLNRCCCGLDKLLRPRARRFGGLASQIAYVGIDFDQTLTTVDTCETVAQAAIINRPDRDAAERAWRQLVETHVQEYNRVVPSLLPSPALRGFDRTRFDQWLRDMQDFDLVANARLEDSQVLSMASLTTLSQSGQLVEWQPAAAEVCRRLAEARHPVEVISASWSSELLEAACESKIGSPLPVPVVANRIMPQDASNSDGHVMWKIRTALDKANLVTHRRVRHGALAVFIGDSAGDLGAMMVADVGIVVGSSGSMRRTLNAFGIRLESIPQLIERLAAGEKPWVTSARTVYSAGSWYEISELLFGVEKAAMT